MSQTHLFTVEMTCGGCSGAVERILGKLKGGEVEDFSVDLEGQKVTVTSSKMSSDEILEKLKKSGKAVSYVGLAWSRWRRQCDHVMIPIRRNKGEREGWRHPGFSTLFSIFFGALTEKHRELLFVQHFTTILNILTLAKKIFSDSWSLVIFGRGRGILCSFPWNMRVT